LSESAGRIEEQDPMLAALPPLKPAENIRFQEKWKAQVEGYKGK